MALAAPNPQLAALEQLLGGRVPDLLYPCIRDPVQDGLGVARFRLQDSRPNRQTWCCPLGPDSSTRA